MLYPRQIKKNVNKISTRKNFLIVFISLIILLITVTYPEKVTSPFRSLTLFVLSIKENILTVMTDFSYVFYSKIELGIENEKLKKQNENLNKNYSLVLDNLKSKNEELEKALGRKTNSIEKNVQTAFVLAKPPITAYDTFIVDLGEKQGIKMGAPVLSGNYLIGFVSKLTKNNSIITIYGNKNEKNTELIVGNNRINLKGKGLGLGSYQIAISGNYEEMTNGNVRISAHPNYLFGKIISPNESSEEKSETITVKTSVNMFELSTVDIVNQ